MVNADIEISGILRKLYVDGVVELGGRIAARLDVLGISQAELARRVGVTQPAINHLIKRGAGGSSRIHQIARELKTSVEYLSGATDDPAMDAAEMAFTSQDREWLDLLHALPPKDRSAVLQLARTIAHGAMSPLLTDGPGELQKRK